MPIVAVTCNFINFLLTFPFLFIFLIFSDVSITSVIQSFVFNRSGQCNFPG
jgi:hypothetical protein